MKTLRVSRINFAQWTIDPKYLTVLIYLTLIAYSSLHGLCNSARALDLPIHPWYFSLYVCNSGTMLSVMLGFLILIADVPFRNRQQQFVLMRTGKRSWLAGQILYLFLLSVLFTLFVWVWTILYILPEVEWSMDWGTFLTSTAIGNAGPYDTGSYGAIKGITPIASTLRTMVTMIAVCFLLGLILMLCNLWTSNGVGAAIVSSLVVLPSLYNVTRASPTILRYTLWISPISWIDRSLLGYTNLYLPSYNFGLYAPIVLDVILCAVAMGTIHRCNLETNKE